MKQKFCYHGIGENLLRYESIMNNGIVSESEGTKIEGFSVNSSGHYNGKDNISVAIPHDDNYGALRVYILDGGISFYIKDVDYILSGNTAHDSGFVDEGFVYKSIKKDNIAGIIINSRTQSKSIRNCSVIGNPALGSIIPITESMIALLKSNGIETSSAIKDLEVQLNRVMDDKEENFLEKDKKVEKIRYKIDQLLGEAVQQFYNKKLEKSDATLMDVIQHYNTNELPILNENDVRIQCKGIQIEQPISRKSFERRMARPSPRNIDDIEATLMKLKKSTRLISKDWRDTND